METAINDAGDRRHGLAARLQLALLDPHVARESGVVATHLLDEALGVLATDWMNVSTASPSGIPPYGGISTTGRA